MASRTGTRPFRFRTGPGGRALWAYNVETRKRQQVDLFNGEIGTVKIHGFDSKKWRNPRFRVDKFQVVFTRKEHLWVNYESDRQVEENLELAYVISVHKAQGSEFIGSTLSSPSTGRRSMERTLLYRAHPGTTALHIVGRRGHHAFAPCAATRDVTTRHVLTRPSSPSARFLRR